MVICLKTIAILGYSGTGKTTLARSIIGYLGRSGLRVSFVKNIPHDDAAFEMAGKDTESTMSAGATLSAGITPSKAFFTLSGHHDLVEIIELAGAWSDACILEGFRNEISRIGSDVIVNISPIGSAASLGVAEVISRNNRASFPMETRMGDLLEFILKCLEDA